MAGRKKQTSATAKGDSSRKPVVKRKTKNEKPAEKPSAVSNQNQPVVITLEPVITLAEVTGLRDKILEHMDASEISIDASGVEHIDTGGMQLLLSVANSIRKKGGKITWVGWSAPCLSTAQLLGLTRLFEMKE